MCYLRGQGWAEPEFWGTWSVGPSAEIELPLPDQNRKALNITIKSLGSNKVNQKVRIFVNEVLINTWTLHSTKNNVLTLNLNDQITQPSLNGLLKIRFETMYPISPSALGIGQDTRNLGIGLISAHFL